MATKLKDISRIEITTIEDNHHSYSLEQINTSEVFNENVEIDARMVLAGMRGGMDAIISWGYMQRETFTNTSMITDRCEWLKKQSEEYIAKVSARAAQLEREKKQP